MEPTHRRTASELDMRSMRRISDALLLAQNRAREATDRANQYEHLLRLVVSQVNVGRLRLDSLADYELLRASLTPNTMLLSPRRRSGSFSSMDSETSVTSSVACLDDGTRDVLANLNANMARHAHYVEQHMTIPKVHWTLWNPRDGYFAPLQLMTGLLAGVVVGVTITKHLLYTQKQETPSLFTKLAKWCSRRAPVPGTPWHLVPLPIDDYSYLVHPATVEVA